MITGGLGFTPAPHHPTPGGGAASSAITGDFATDEEGALCGADCPGAERRVDR